MPAVAQPQDAFIPQDFYDPQLLEFTDWSVYTGTRPVPDLETLDLSDWSPIPESGASIPQGQVTWFRIDFTIGWHFRSRDLGLYLGNPKDAHEIYLNGRLIGGEGDLSSHGYGSAGKPSLSRLPQLGMWYSFMNLERSNVLILAVKGLTQPGTFDPDEIVIDNMDRAILFARNSEDAIKIQQGSTISVLLLISLFCGFLFVSGFREKSNLLFGFFVLVAAVTIFLESLFIYDLGLRTVALERGLCVARQFVACLFYMLIRSEVGASNAGPNVRLADIIWFFVGTSVLAALPIVPMRILDLSTDLIAIAFVSYAVWMSGLAALRSVRQTLLMALLGLVFAVACVYQLFKPSPFHAFGQVDLAYCLVAVTFLFLIAQRYQELSSNLAAVSRRLVSVRDLERARLARDIHDGLGQGIAATGLHLKILAAKRDGNEFAKLTGSIDDLNLHLSEVIGDLRPSILQDRTLGSAIEMHLEKSLTGTGITYDCVVDKKREMPFELKEQLFRIYQESLNNAMKHADCTNFSVELRGSGPKMLLFIRDDGTGFVVGRKRNLGLGLSTMRERASLVNGSYRLESAPGHGTSVSVEVSIND
ncbi:sensor histidine kinase [Rhodobacteraceae bacterium F11138]|nr:sensor histidine kinase [Rhodobacteraceae bacterium F11138]